MAYSESLHAFARAVQSNGWGIEVTLWNLLIILSGHTPTNAEELFLAVIILIGNTSRTGCLGRLA